MCEIFAVNARRARLVNASLREFFADSPRHPHGWGLAWRRVGYDGLDGTSDDEWWVDKEPLPAYGSDYLAYLLREPIRTGWLVAHIRNATRGVVTYENCHPFRGAAAGSEWVFAHNGTILREDETAAYAPMQRGGTDSERVLLHLLDLLEREASRHGGALTAERRLAVLSQALNTLADGNKLNVVFGDGTYTYVHTNTTQSTLWRHHDANVAYFCTRPLGTGEGWEPVPKCQLVVYANGQVVGEGPVHAHSFDDELYREIIAREQEAASG